MELKVYYVYRHTFADGSLYVGKGKAGRSTEFKRGRSGAYLSLLENFGPPNVDYIREGLSENEAYQLENREITYLRARGEKIINRTDGLELGDVGSMPPRTLLFISKNKFVHPRYKQIIHLQNTKRPGSYSLCVTIVEAAIKMNITCDEVIEFIENDLSKERNGFRVMDQEEAFQVIPYYKDKIIEITNKAIEALDQADS